MKEMHTKTTTNSVGVQVSKDVFCFINLSLNAYVRRQIKWNCVTEINSSHNLIVINIRTNSSGLISSQVSATIYPPNSRSV